MGEVEVLNIMPSWQSQCETIEDSNRYLLETGNYSDVTFIVGEEKEKIKAHKLILTSRSSVFEAMLQRWETENGCQIVIPEISPENFKAFLRFAYFDEFDTDLAVNDVIEVLYLAHKYNLEALELYCKTFLIAIIDTSNALKIFEVGVKLEEKAIEKPAWEFILKKGKEIYQDSDFLQIGLDTLSVILENDKKTDMLIIFSAVMKWAENMCQIKSLSCTGENKRNVLNGLLNLIQFADMTQEDFTEEVLEKHEGILSDKEIIQQYKDFTKWKAKGIHKIHLSRTPSPPAEPELKSFQDIYNSIGLSLDRTNRNLHVPANSSSVTVLKFTSNRKVLVKSIWLLDDLIPWDTQIGDQSNPLYVIMKVTTPLKSRPNSVILKYREIIMPSFSRSRIKLIKPFSVSKNVLHQVSLRVYLGTAVTDKIQRRPEILDKSSRANCGNKKVVFNSVSERTRCDVHGVDRCICSGQFNKFEFSLC